MSDSKYAAILKWYTGKAQGVIRDYVLPTLAQAEADGYWPKGASRKVAAALNKQAVAQKFAFANDDRGKRRTATPGNALVEVTADEPKTYMSIGWRLKHAMMYGHVTEAPKLQPLVKLLKPTNDEQCHAVATAALWVRDFAPVGALMNLLDSRRPPITIVFKSLSPTVAANVLRDVAMDLTTLRCPPVRYEWVTRVDKTGVEYQEMVGFLEWPPGTLFTSRFKGLSPAGNEQCHACGHAIKDRSNWVPLLADKLNSEGYRGLWVGRDCARKLFGADVSGEGVFDGAPGTMKTS